MTERIRETDDGTYPYVEEEKAKNKAREVEYAPSALAAMQGKGSIQALCERSHAIAKEKGWCDTPRPIHSTTNLMQSELAEALEDFRAHRALSEIYYEETKVAAGPQVPRSPRCEIGYHQPTATGYCSCWTVDKKPCGIPIELADCLIRIAQYCGTEGLDLQGASERAGKDDARSVSKLLLTKDIDFELMLAKANYFISQAFGATFEFENAADDLNVSLPDGEVFKASKLMGLVSLGRAWNVIFDFCNQDLPDGNIKLWAAIDEKEAYNKSRSYRHGGKKV